MALPLIIGGLGLAQGFLSYAGSYSAAKAMELEAEKARIRGDFEKKSLENQAKYTEIQASDARDNSNRQAAEVYKRGLVTRGAQRARLAASGNDITSGSAADIIDHTQTVTERDLLMVKSNAFREAWGFKKQASDLRFGASMAELGAGAEAAAYKAKGKATLLTGGIELLKGGGSMFAGLKEAGAFKRHSQLGEPDTEEEAAGKRAKKRDWKAGL